MNRIDMLEHFCKDEKISIRLDVPLSRMCTFQIGGPADAVVEPDCDSQLQSLTAFLSARNIPFLVLGRGSNVLFPDEGLRGVVILLGERFSAMELTNATTIRCQSGASVIALSRFAQKNGLAGLEFAYGIPGSVGGGIYMNAGAYGGEMKDVLTETFHIGPDGVGFFSGKDMRLGYRTSTYSGTELIITGGLFSLSKDDPAAILARMEDYMNRRRTKQPLDLPSAGSTFKRPEGAYASALIDQCGLKGRAVGGAAVSEKHAGFVVNKGGATCKDVLELLDIMTEEVLRQTGFTLRPEIRIYNSNLERRR